MFIRLSGYQGAPTQQKEVTQFYQIQMRRKNRLDHSINYRIMHVSPND